MYFSVNTAAASMTIPTKQNNANRDLLICSAENHLFISPIVEAYSEPCQTSDMEVFQKIVNDSKQI